MARPSTRTSLSVSREEAERVLEETITRGQRILDDAESIRDEPTFEAWAREATNWRRFAITALQSISEGDALEQELRTTGATARVAVVGGPRPSVAELLDRRRRTHELEINILRSVVERLPLMPAPIDKARASDPPIGNDVFVVHGRRQESAELVARLAERLGFNAIILDEQANEGGTLIEKVERNSESVGFAVVLMLADDWGRGPDEADWPASPNRARQNVILELGYFIGKLGRSRVAVLIEDGVEKPSDFHGVAHISFDDDWKIRLLREMKVVFPDLDANKVF